jgi:hypothetical protein
MLWPKGKGSSPKLRRKERPEPEQWLRQLKRGSQSLPEKPENQSKKTINEANRSKLMIKIKARSKRKLQRVESPEKQQQRMEKTEKPQNSQDNQRKTQQNLHLSQVLQFQLLPQQT